MVQVIKVTNGTNCQLKTRQCNVYPFSALSSVDLLANLHPQDCIAVDGVPPGPRTASSIIPSTALRDTEATHTSE